MSVDLRIKVTKTTVLMRLPFYQNTNPLYSVPVGVWCVVVYSRMLEYDAGLPPSYSNIDLEF